MIADLIRRGFQIERSSGWGQEYCRPGVGLSTSGKEIFQDIFDREDAGDVVAAVDDDTNRSAAGVEHDAATHVILDPHAPFGVQGNACVT